MGDTQNYPSPTQAQMSSGAGPFYQQQQHHASPSHDIVQDVDDDAQLRADLSRSLMAQPPPPPLPPPQDEQSLHAQIAPSHPHPQHYEHEHEHEQHDPLAQNLMGLQEHQHSPMDHQSLDADGKAKDKRQKVSRACDECRRKKIRCDAPDEIASEPCSSCRRTNVLCAFSRQPMKRGPSKGYIKTLADRLNTLENQLHPPHMQAQHAEMQFLQEQLAINNDDQYVPQPLPRGPDMQTFASPPVHAGRKRTHSFSEGNNLDMQGLGMPRPNYEPQMQYMDAQRHMPPYPASSVPTSGAQTPQDPIDGRRMHSPPLPMDAQPFFKYGADLRRRESVSVPFDSDAGNIISLLEWDEEVVDEYYRIIHQTFPLLPHSKHRLRLRLAECPTSLREAFLTVLSATMRTFPSSTLRANQVYTPAMKRAAEQLAGYPFENPGSHTSATNLVYLQTLLLMALESDNHGPATMRGQAGPSRAEWLGRAAGVAGQLEINLIRPRERFATEGDPDSEERLARRVWWVLFILDRWHASSTADLLKLPENSVVLLPEDQILLGESTYHLARLSFIIGHLAAILTTTKTPETNVMSPSNPASALLGLTLAGEIDRFRESVESVWGSLNLVHLSYHHSHLLIKRLSPTTEPSELIGHALKVATVLNQRQTPITPLNHHFAALSAMTLCELVDVDKTRADAARGLDQLSEALGLGRGLAGHQESSGWDSAIRELVITKKARLQSVAGAAGTAGDSLQQQQQHLGNGFVTPARGVPEGNVAATAAGAAGGERGKSKFDATMLTRYGYLTALGQGMFHSR